MQTRTSRALLALFFASAAAWMASGEDAMGWSAKDWKKPSENELEKKLSDEQFKVTQKEGTERPFHNEYWDNHKPGLYVDVVSGEPLFSSNDKFESGTGWPSFTKPLKKEAVSTKSDSTLGMTRTEVRGHLSDSHLGHLFDDGPKDKGGMRYCMNSASLKFIPAENLANEGYGEFADLFKGDAKAAGAKHK